MRLKAGSKWVGLKPEILLGMMVARSVWEDHGYEFIATEGTGGNHMNGSLHYNGLACDIRTRNVPKDLHNSLVADLRRRLTDDYDVVLHSSHVHLEFDEKASN